MSNGTAALIFVFTLVCFAASMWRIFPRKRKP